MLLEEQRAQGLLQRAIIPLIVSAIFHSLWSNPGGGDRDAHVGQLGLPLNKVEDVRKDKEGKEEEGKQGWTQWEAETGQY